MNHGLTQILPPLDRTALQWWVCTPHIEGRDLTVVCQVSVWPPRADIFLADPAAIKVRDILPRIGYI